MLRKDVLRLVVRLAILMALAGSLLTLSAGVTENTAYAKAACICDLEHQQCVANCPPLGQPGRFACIGACNSQWEDCQPSCF
jgi:hypothetical protein